MGKDKTKSKEKKNKESSEPKINLLGIGQRLIEAGGIAAGAMSGALLSDYLDFNNGARLVTIGGGAVAGYGIGRGVNVGMAALIMANKEEDADEESETDEDDDE